MDDIRDDSQQPSYEPPQVEDMPTQDGPTVVAAGGSPPQDFQLP